MFPNGHHRWQTSLVLLVSVVIGYLDRLNITLALPKMAEEHGWSVAETAENGSMLMSTFYIAYGIANILFSPYGAKIGPRKSLLIIVVLWSVFTAAGAIFGQILTLFLATRILLGLSEGIHFPMMSIITQNWFPVHERSRGNGLWISGIFVATILAPILLVPIIERFSWRTMFYLLSLAGLVITLPLMYRYIYASPEDHPGISAEERKYILSQRETDADAAIPMIRLFRSRLFVLAFTAGIFNNIVAHGLVSWLPTYFTRGRGLDFGDLSYAMSLPYAFSILGILLWSYLGDRSNQRILLAATGFILAGISTFFALKAGSIVITVLILSMAVFFVTAYITSEYAIIQRILPRSSLASGVGLYNGLTTMIGGGLGPLVVGKVVTITGSWTSGVMTLAGVCGIAALILIILSRSLKY